MGFAALLLKAIFHHGLALGLGGYFVTDSISRRGPRTSTEWEVRCVVPGDDFTFPGRGGAVGWAVGWAGHWL
eukprot:12650695-Alexandrium_andersonii.AAC.1